MSAYTTVHNVILLPSSTLKIICSDGLSLNEIQKIKKIFNFGGKIEVKDCGPEVEEHVLHKSIGDMLALWDKYAYELYGENSKETKDVYTAEVIDEEKYYKWKDTSLFKQWEQTPDGAKFLNDYL